VEQRLEARLQYAFSGELFPQFAGNWAPQIDRTAQLFSRLCEVRNERKRIALVASDPVRFWACFFVVANGDWDIFLFNPHWGEKERKEALEVARPQWVIDGASIEKEIEAEITSEETKTVIEGFRVMIPTGGSSGKIRFAIHDWETLSAAVEGLRKHFDSPTISSLCVLPLYHVSGFMQTIRSALTGGKVVFNLGPSFIEDCQALFSLAPEDRFLSLVPTQLRKLLRDDSSVRCLGEFRAIFCGGGPLPQDLARASREARLPLAPTYGMTETAAQVATLFPEEFLAGVEGQGSPLPHACIDILNTELKFGSVGNVSVQSSSLFRGYFGDAVRGDLPFAAGDLGKKDEKGRISIVGRSGRTIISGGENIDLQEIENAVIETRLIKDVVAFGVDDERWGTRLCIAYTGVDEKNVATDLKLAIGRRLASYKQPKFWLNVDALPTNGIGKVDMVTLRKLIEESDEADVV
tara:strand:- start:635 stop:2029 length:1395 start_codon:yes stop_codon:yes gene_type:complete